MSRLSTMARFAEPDEPVRVRVCDNCNDDLHEGDSVITFEGNTYCNTECLASDLGASEEIL